jgi:hypothetical protein
MNLAVCLFRCSTNNLANQKSNYKSCTAAVSNGTTESDSLVPELFWIDLLELRSTHAHLLYEIMMIDDDN